MAYEDGYTGIGQASNPVPASAHEDGYTRPMTGTPEGIKPTGGFGDLTADQERAYPKAPVGYDPSPLAPVRHSYEDSTLYKIGSVLASFGETVPVNLKIKMAQQEADLAMSKDKLAWNNYYKSNQEARDLAQKQNRQAQTEFLTTLPSIKAHIEASAGADPADRQNLVNHLKKVAGTLYPGASDMIQHFADNMSTVYAGDAILSHPDKSISGPAIIRSAEMGYDNWIKSPQHAQIALGLNRDWTSAAYLRTPTAVKDKAAAGKLSEQEFRDSIKQAGYEKGMRPVEISSMLAHLDTPEGEQQMAGIGVHTDKSALAAQMKAKEGTTTQQLHDRDLQEYDTILKEAKKNPKLYPPEYLAQVQEKYDILMHLKAPETNPGANENNIFNQQFEIDTQGKLKSVGDIEKLPLPERAKYYKIADATKAKIAARQPNANVDAKMSAPGDTSNYLMAGDLRNGRLTPVRGTVSEGDLRDSSKYIKVTPDQKKELRDIEATAASADQIFALADKAYAGDDNQYLLGTAEMALRAVPSGPTDLLTIGPQIAAKKNYPLLNDYVSRREATLGKFARSVSGEVGVLTDQDTSRVRNLFPAAGDTNATRGAKKRALQSLVKLNAKFAHQVLAGELSPVEIDNLKNSDVYRQAAQGILGSVEPKATEKTTNKAAPKSGGVQGLMDDMDAKANR